MTAPPPWTPYCGAAPLPAELLGRWNLDPFVLAALVLLGWAGSRALRPPLAYAAVAILALLFVSPFCALGSALFSARVVHHVVLIAVAAPFLAFAVARQPSPPGSLAGWTALHAVVVWFWHAPPVYGWALASDFGYWAMQLSLLASAAGFWFAVRHASPTAAAAALLATMVLMGLLGALITFAGAPLYAPHLASTAAWGLTPFEDQQLAGLIMWAPASALYLGAALWLLGRWLRQGDAVPAR